VSCFDQCPPCEGCAAKDKEIARLTDARGRLREALKLCAGVLSGAELSKGALVRALKAALAALAPDTAKEEP
jgi:hypothetical protein